MMQMPIDPGELFDGDLVLAFQQFAMHPAHKVPTYHFQMQHRETDAVMGDIRLRLGATEHVLCYAGHIGYAVHAEYRGHRYAERAVRLLLPLAHATGLDPLWITCDPENIASRRTLERAGAKFVEVVDVPEDCIIYKSGHPRKCRYRLATGGSGGLTARKLE